MPWVPLGDSQPTLCGYGKTKSVDLKPHTTKPDSVKLSYSFSAQAVLKCAQDAYEQRNTRSVRGCSGYGMRAGFPEL